MGAVAIRPFVAGDAAVAARLFYDSVRAGADGSYTADQRAAWAPAVPAPDDWGARLAAMSTLVAVRRRAAREEMLGFMARDSQGHIELAFVRPDRIGTGLGGRLYDALEARARADGLTRLTADASMGMRRLLESRGWRVVRAQRPVREGVALTNYAMEKVLDA